MKKSLLCHDTPRTFRPTNAWRIYFPSRRDPERSPRESERGCAGSQLGKCPPAADQLLSNKKETPAVQPCTHALREYQQVYRSVAREKSRKEVKSLQIDGLANSIR